jgi:hypothetical protein
LPPAIAPQYIVYQCRRVRLIFSRKSFYQLFDFQFMNIIALIGSILILNQRFIPEFFSVPLQFDAVCLSQSA